MFSDKTHNNSFSLKIFHTDHTVDLNVDNGMIALDNIGQRIDRVLGVFVDKFLANKLRFPDKFDRLN